jgi:hypothetical protein
MVVTKDKIKGVEVLNCVNKIVEWVKAMADIEVTIGQGLSETIWNECIFFIN